MICTSLQNKDLAQIQALLEGLEMAEIRLDRCALEDEEIDALFSDTDVPLIATCRLEEESQAPELLERAIRAGAKYVDLEMEAPAAIGRRIRQACQEWGTVLIRSYHNFENTPSREVLLSLFDRARSFGGEVVKIVTTAHSKADNDVVLSLYDAAEPGTLVAFCMGEEGRPSRLEALRRGAPFTYACLSPEDATAAGQWTVSEMQKAVYGDYRFIRSGELPMPSSKSFAQRAIVAAALADGVSVLEGYSPCGDNESALAVARALGAEVSLEGSRLTIKGIAAAPACLQLEELHCGESGLLTRLMIPLLSTLSDGRGVRVTGEKTLLDRPLSQAHDIMASFGVRLYPDDSNARKVDCYLPLKVSAPLIPGRADVSGKGGSQLISGLLATLPLADGKSTVYVHEPRSIPYLFITVDVLKKFGVRIGSEMEGDDDFLENQDWSRCTAVNFHIKGGQRYQAAHFAIEADWSAAAPFLVAGALFGEVEVTGLDTTSLQADISILDILMQAGASMSQLEEPTGSIRVRRAPLSAFDADLNNCPDLFPVVAVLAAFCPGESHILGVQRLRHKETDRAAAIEEMLTQMGVPVRTDDDEMTITGMGLTQRLATGKLLKGGSYASYADHRMVMALRLASLGASAPIEIDDTACVAKSFPAFNEMFSAL
ncbi:MAG: 3-phosphoshikimate 1-carboxyvinyltransferase [Bacteroidales bacterium]|nr:3-phosphoshikimate 1-carboxyvinyltransferase [Bacteroidales bacterium]